MTVTFRSAMPYARKDTIIWQKGMYYHIYNRGARHRKIFLERTNYLFTISKLKQYSQAQGIRIIAYCLMPTHYHLLVRQEGETPAGNLPQLVFNSYSKAYNRMYGQSGTLFEGRFRAKAIQTSNHLLHLCCYIHGNPTKDGIVGEPQDWPYSNYLEWIEERPDALVDRNFINDQFCNAEEYRKSLTGYLHTLRLPDGVQNHVYEIEK